MSLSVILALSPKKGTAPKNNPFQNNQILKNSISIYHVLEYFLVISNSYPLQLQPQIKVAKESKIRKCQCCKTGNLHTILLFDQRGPPAWYLGGSQKSPACKN
jgi:hypothetical protein